MVQSFGQDTFVAEGKTKEVEVRWEIGCGHETGERRRDSLKSDRHN